MTEINITPAMIEYESEEVYARDEVNRFYVNYDGRRYRVSLMADYDSSPDGEECYSEEDIDAWGRDVWSYVSVTVAPVGVPEAVQFMLSDDLGGVEYNFPMERPLTRGGVRITRTDDNYLAMVHPVPDMIDVVRGKVAAWEKQQALYSYLYS